MAQRVLMVVDPDPATARKVKRALHGLAFEVVAVRGLAAALEYPVVGNLSAVVSALHLPDGSGYDLCRRFRDSGTRTSVFLLFGGFDVLDPEEAQAAGIDAGIRRPLTTDSLVGHLEEVLGPLPVEVNAEATDEAEDLPGSNIESLETHSFAILARSEASFPAPPSSQERLATFIPHDYESLPQVAVDAEVVGAAMEKAILAVLPEVVEVVLDKALRQSEPFRTLVRDSVARSVRELLPAVARGVVKDYLKESGGDLSGT